MMGSLVSTSTSVVVLTHVVITHHVRIPNVVMIAPAMMDLLATAKNVSI